MLPVGGRSGRGVLRDSPADPARAIRFTALNDTHYHRILGYAARRIRREDAVDVAAETFAVAWRRLDDVPQGEPALHWLYGTARRVLANHLRSERRRAALTSAIEREPAAATSLGVSARSPRVAAAFAQLRDD